MAYSKQTWDTTSYVNPTRMNHIEQGIYDISNKEFLTELSTVSSTTTETEVDISSIADYKELLFLARANNEIRGSIIIPTDLFKLGYYTYIIAVGGTMSYITVKYVSDTKIKVQAGISAMNRVTIYAR